MDEKEEKLDLVLTILKLLSNDERRELFTNFCHCCGDTDPRCQCWNDE